MCYNCGCGMPTDDMGYKPVSVGGGGLVESDFEAMAKKTKMNIKDTKKEVLKMLESQLKS